MIKTYSLKKDGNLKLTPHFSVYEYACPGTDVILIDTALSPGLELLRGSMKLDMIKVVCGYRTPEYNATLKNASKTSNHLKGMAADVCCYKNGKIVDIKYAACAAEIIGFDGIGIMQTCIHVDYRGYKSYFDENFKNTRIENLPGAHRSWFTYCKVDNLDFMENPFTEPTKVLRKGDKNEQVRWLQFELIKLGFLDLIAPDGTCNVDGSYGGRTEQAVRALQMAYFEDEAEWDGKFGPHSKEALKAMKKR